MYLSKKGLSAVVATSLLIVVAVTALVSFQTWFGSYSSSLYVQVENTNTNLGTKVEAVIDNTLYFNNEYSNLTINDIKVDGVSCNVSGNYNKSIKSFDLNNCIVSSSKKINEVAIYTNQGVFSSDFLAKEQSTSSQETGPIYTTEFISSWNTSITGVSASNQIALPLESTGSYNFNVTGDTLVGSPITITSYTNNTLNFTAPGVHEITITGEIVGWRFNNGGDKDKLLEISQWGPLRLGNNEDYFKGASNFDFTGSDSLNLSGTTSLNFMFQFATNFNGNISNWDVSEVTSMNYMFSGAEIFNHPLNSWNTSSVTQMWGVFENTDEFNQPLNNWDVSSVTNMGGMFRTALKFNQPLDNWDTSSLISFGQMFKDAISFNQSLNSWDVSNVASLTGLFENARKFNQPLNDWNVSSVTNMDSTFRDSQSFNQPLNNWVVNNVTNMDLIFADAINFNQNISMWNVSQVTSCLNYDFGTSSWEAGNKPAFVSC